MITLHHKNMPVTFHKSPLMGQPDFPWVDILQLAAALGSHYPSDAIIRLCQSFPDCSDLVKTVTFEGRISTIVAHPVAQSLAGALDRISGTNEAGDGQRHIAYTLMSAKAAQDGFNISLDEIFSVFRRYNSESGAA